MTATDTLLRCTALVPWLMFGGPGVRRCGQPVIATGLCAECGHPKLDEFGDTTHYLSGVGPLCSECDSGEVDDEGNYLPAPCVFAPAYAHVDVNGPCVFMVGNRDTGQFSCRTLPENHGTVTHSYTPPRVELNHRAEVRP